MQTAIFSAPDLNLNEPEVNGWVALDAGAEWPTFSTPVGDEPFYVWESRIRIEGMHCASCVFAIEKAVKSVNGVLSVHVNAASGRSLIKWSAKKTKPSAWMRAISEAGYRAFPQTSVDIESRKQQRLLMWRWLVAGLCMMQIMMYAMPTYVAEPGEMTPDIERLLRWASWVLTLPVLLFSSAPFFTNAVNDIKQHRISMDFPVALGILISFCVSSVATFEPNGWWGREVYFDSLTMLVFFLLTGRWLEARLRDRTAGALDSLMCRLPSSIERRNLDGSFSRVAIRSLQSDDVIRVYPGEAFPADGKIISGNTNADEALLTGESRPVSKELGAKVIAGSHNLVSAVTVQVEGVGAATQYAQIVALMERVAVDKPRLAQLADRIAKPFLWLVMLAAAISAALLWQQNHGHALMAAVAVLIVTCPCALSLATPAAMLTSAGALARKGILVRRLQALEALATTDTIIFDKTGTLTKDNIYIFNISTALELSANQALQLAASIAQYSLHPVARTLLNAWGKSELVAVSEVQEHSGLGLSANTPIGQVRLGSARYCAIEVEEKGATQVHLSNAHGWLATFNLQEEVRADAKAVIHELQKANFNVLMLSGDRLASAEKVARQVGIRQVFADCTPQQKLEHLQTLQRQGRKVVMVGDGLNDGPVLAGANVSVAMGQAVPLAQAQSDFVVLSGQLSVLPALIYKARKTMRVVKQNLLWAAVYNAACVPLAVVGYLPAWLAGLGMAASSLLVILNAARLTRGSVP
jgi:Cu2+-exporting ATPase